MTSIKSQSGSSSILVLSDIHYCIKNITLLRESTHLFDYVFCLGDIANLKGEQFKNTNEIEKAKIRIKEILEELESMARVKLIVLLGNHDHFSMLEEPDRWNTEKTMLLQGVLTEPGTVFPVSLFVHGGSPPGYFLADHDKPRIKGYPFDTRQEFNEDLDRCMENSGFEQKVRGKQAIWLTHCGPTESKSSVTHIPNEGAVESGSERYRQWIREWQEAGCEVIAWVHGHCHDGAGTEHVAEGVPVYNGAAFIDGNYLTMELVEENTEDGVRWRLVQVKLHNLKQGKSECEH